ncbi:MAG: DUF1127 domain-containing protein [Rhodobacteraceae bacterium]|nr:DUF1127 domain-containing protein [Paracoccaceae bacterium]
MSVATAAPYSIDFRSIADSLAPGAIRFDPLGIVSGYKAYMIYTGLAAKSDAELADIGLKRTDISRVAMQAVNLVR